MEKKLAFSINFAEIQERIATDFRNLNPNDPSTWPALPKYFLYVSVAMLVIVAAWFLFISSYQDELDVEVVKEATLRTEYTKKMAQAVNLEALKKQREQVQQFVTQLERQLPSKAEMDALLSDVNQAGLGRNLQFDLFRPGQVVVKEYYAELPIAVKVTGRYHDIGAFASDIAHLSRIVTLGNLSVGPLSNSKDNKDNKDNKDASLSMEGIAKTYRYLDPEEVVAQRKSAQGDKK
jgi:type IV pilus assembly protein PilO